jgi:uncharacterized protein (DUF1330 family)
VSTYFIAQISIHDPEEYEKYLSGFNEVFSRYDAEVVLVDENPELLEGEWTYSRIVIIRFRNRDEAKRWYGSPEYQRLVQHRYSASKADVILAEGRDS